MDARLSVAYRGARRDDGRLTPLPRVVFAGLVACPKIPPEAVVYGIVPLPTALEGHAEVLDATDPQRDATGHTSRLGGGWSVDAPTGSVDAYRRDDGICRGWNNLAWLTPCTSKAGALVAIGPGQSAAAQVCGDTTEAYPANPGAWQRYVDKPWSRPDELACPPEAEDHPVDPADLAQPS